MSRSVSKTVTFTIASAVVACAALYGVAASAQEAPRRDSAVGDAMRRDSVSRDMKPSDSVRKSAPGRDGVPAQPVRKDGVSRNAGSKEPVRKSVPTGVDRPKK